MEHTWLYERLAAESVRNHILRIENVPNFEGKLSKLHHPSLLTGIKLWLTKNVGQRVVVSPHSEWGTSQPVAEFVTAHLNARNTSLCAG